MASGFIVGEWRRGTKEKADRKHVSEQVTPWASGPLRMLSAPRGEEAGLCILQLPSVTAGGWLLVPFSCVLACPHMLLEPKEDLRQRGALAIRGPEVVRRAKGRGWAPTAAAAEGFPVGNRSELSSKRWAGFTGGEATAEALPCRRSPGEEDVYRNEEG